MTDRHAWEDELAEQEISNLRAEVERLRTALATTRLFIEGEMIAGAVVVPEGKMANDPTNPSLLQMIDCALEQNAGPKC